MMRPGAPAVQLFGRKDSRDTQKALRFFSERQIAVSFVDIARKPLAPTELRRFSERLGAAALLDTEGRRHGELGLRWMRFGDEEIVDRLLADPGLLRLPLVRHGTEVTVGLDEPTWRRWTAGSRSGR